MQPIPLLVATLLGLVALAYVLYPLYRRVTTRSETGSGQGFSTESGLSEREQNARQALQEVDFDFQLGNLDEGDYRSLRTRYLQRAVVEMKERHQREQEIDDEIEQQLQTLKDAEKATPAEGEVDAEV